MATCALSQLIEKHGQQSEFSNTKALKITDSKFNYNLDGGRWLYEITNRVLIDNEGHQYFHNVLSNEQLFELIDHLIEVHVKK